MSKSLKSDNSFLEEYSDQSTAASSSHRSFSPLILSSSHSDPICLRLIKKRRYSLRKIIIYTETLPYPIQRGYLYSKLKTHFVTNLEGDLSKISRNLHIFKRFKCLKRIKFVPSGFIYPEFAVVKLCKKLKLNNLSTIDLGFIIKSDHRVIPRIIGHTKRIGNITFSRSAGFQGSFNDWIEKRSQKCYLSSIGVNKEQVNTLKIDLPLFFLFEIKEYVSTLVNLNSLTLASFSLPENEIIIDILPALNELNLLKKLFICFSGKFEEIFVLEILQQISSIKTLREFCLRADISFKKRIKLNLQELANKLTNLEELNLNLAPRSYNFASKRSYYDFFTRLIPLNHFRVLSLCIDSNFPNTTNSEIENFCGYIKALSRIQSLTLQFCYTNILVAQWKLLVNALAKLETLEKLEIIEQDHMTSYLDVSIVKQLLQKLLKIRVLTLDAVAVNNEERELVHSIVEHPGLEELNLTLICRQRSTGDYDLLYTMLKECHIVKYVNQLQTSKSPDFMNKVKRDVLFSKFYSFNC